MAVNGAIFSYETLIHAIAGASVSTLNNIQIVLLIEGRYTTWLKFAKFEIGRDWEEKICGV